MDGDPHESHIHKHKLLKVKVTYIKYLWIIEMEWLGTKVASWETNFCKLRSSEIICSDFLITSKFLVCAESLQSCLTLFNPMNGSPPDSSVHGVFSTQGSNLHPLHLLHWQTDSSLLVLPGKSKVPYILPKIPKWYTYECFLYFRALRQDVWIHSVFNPLYFTFDLKCPWKTLIPFLC